MPPACADLCRMSAVDRETASPARELSPVAIVDAVAGTVPGCDLLWTVVIGLVFLVVVGLFWGRYYLLGLAHLLVAALMPLRLDLAPVVHGVFAAGCVAWGAWDHYRSARREKPQP